MSNINWSMTAQVSGGPKLSLSKTFEVDAYDEVEADVPSDNSPKTLEVQPSSSTERVKFLVISSTQYSKDITYSLGGDDTDDTDDTTEIKLDAPQVFLGEGAISLLGEQPPKTISFTNDCGKDVRISILVGRTPIVGSS